MGKDNKSLNNVLQSLGWEIHDAQLVMTSSNDDASVCSWLSKEGVLYLNEANDQAKEGEKLQRVLKKAGYHVEARCYII